MRRVFVYRNGKVIERSRAPLPDGLKVMSDIDPFVSPIDGQVVGSRSDRREHNKRHGVIDVGNDPAVLRRKPAYEPKGIGEEIARIFD